MTEQFWVVAEGSQWCVRRREPLATHGWETVKRFRSEGLAVAWAADRNARAMGLAAPQRRTPTAAEVKALFDGLDATPIVNRRGDRYAVHHRNQHSE